MSFLANKMRLSPLTVRDDAVVMRFNVLNMMFFVNGIVRVYFYNYELFRAEEAFQNIKVAQY